jgi:2-octaprenyl-6-methoxyphenol hydroxylase
MHQDQKIQHRDVIILGGGLVGALLGVALYKHNIACQIVDRQKLEDQFDPLHDGRTTAVNAGCKKIFEALGVWAELENFATPIHEIRVYEHGSPWSIDYSSKEIGGEPMGYIIENHRIRRAIHAQIKNEDISWHVFNAPPSVQFHDSHATVEVDGITYQAPLVIGAEGRHSPSRSLTNVRASTWDYGQTALVCHVTHEKTHNNTAWEVFTSSGPFALLPMPNCAKTDLPQSGVVWSNAKDSKYLSMDDQDLEDAMKELFPLYGDFKINSKRWTFPLTGLRVSSCVDKRYALVGDAAHVMHPIAGQGVNLGWRDAFALSNILHEAKLSGQDFGSSVVLSQYARERNMDHRKLILGTDLIHRLFMSSSKIAKLFRTTGFAVVNNVSPLRRLFMRQAMGI